MPKRYLVTSALPYANGPLHIGHLAGAYLPADIYVRHMRNQGEDVIFICGTDEYGTAITETARKQGKTPIEVADENHEIIQRTFEHLMIHFDHFSRTTADIHKQTAQEFFLTLHEKGLIYQETSAQLYDPTIKKFLADRQIRGTCNFCGHSDAHGDQCEKCGRAINPLELINPKSSITGADLESRETTHWYFPFDQHQAWLEEYIASHPEWKQQVLGFCQGQFREGLKPRPLTRDLDWGIPVPLPDHEGKVLYVWFDAPIGYISATKEWAEKNGFPDEWKEFWLNEETELVHFIGKDNTIFHTLLFPAWCHAHGDFIVASQVPANEFLNLEGQKISTSRNHAIWLHEIAEQFPSDYIRYYLASIMPESADADWKWEDFKNKVNSDLNDNLGNFIQRTLKFVQKFYDGTIPSSQAYDESDLPILDKLKETLVNYQEHMIQFKFKAALKSVLDLGEAANAYFQSQEPWRLRTEDPDRCAAVIGICVEICYSFTALFDPFMPKAAMRLERKLNLPIFRVAPFPLGGHKISDDQEPLFQKIDSISNV